MEVAQSTGELHPRFFFRCWGRQFFLDGFGNELAQGDSSLRRFGFGLAKNRIRDFESRLHNSSIPYLWEPLYACQTISPPRTVATGPPLNVRPWNGELRLFENDLFTS